MARKYPFRSVSLCPFTVAVDTREQAPFAFLNINSDVKDGGGPLVIKTITRTLRSGDYSIDGYDDLIAIERKSLEDCYGTLSHRREAFEAELARLDFMHWACVIVEAGWGRIIGNPPQFSKLAPKSVSRSIIAYMQRFPRVHWVTAPDRRFAEVMTFRMLERFWKDRLDVSKSTTAPEVAHAASRS